MKKLNFYRVNEHGKTTSYEISKISLLLFAIYSILLPVFCGFLLWEFISQYAKHLKLNEEYQVLSQKFETSQNEIQKIYNYISYLEVAGEDDLASILSKNAPNVYFDSEENNAQESLNSEDQSEDIEISESIVQIEPLPQNEDEQNQIEQVQNVVDSKEKLLEPEDEIQEAKNEEEIITQDLPLQEIAEQEIPEQENFENESNSQENIVATNESVSLESAEPVTTNTPITNFDAFNAAEESLPLEDINENSIEESTAVFEPFDKKIVEVRDMHTEISYDNENIEVYFSLYNLSGIEIAGDCTFTLYKSGNPNDTRQLIKQRYTSFSIKNMKEISTNLYPSRGLITLKDSIKLDIYIGEELVYSKLIDLG